MMKATTELAPAFEQARKLHADGRLAEAEKAYRQLAKQGGQRSMALEALVDLFLQTQRPNDAVQTLVQLTDDEPDSLFYYVQLANLLDSLGDTEAAIGHYLSLLDRQPKLAAAHFNIALLYKKNKRYADAIAAYENAIRFDIDDIQEVYSNMGVLYSEMRNTGKAREMYERSLKIAPGYIPALFNLAGLFEELGDRQQATEQYRRILAIEPKHWDSLARLAYAKKISAADDSLIKSIKAGVEEAAGDRLAQEGLYFSLGKAMDDLEQYDEAISAYHTANEIGRLRNPPYDRLTAEQAFDSLISMFDRDWIKNSETQLAAAPIFICGMYRSGSTLIEQILAAHRSITAGGELDSLPWLLARRLAPYPQIAHTSKKELQNVAGEYLSALNDLFQNAENVTDKRPDNFLHLGLIRAMFPAARIIYTKRAPVDNCLSVYFQQLGGNVSYATDLQYTAHYYKQHERLMAHWNSCFGGNIFAVDYDELVRSPEPVIRGLLDFLQLDWDEQCLSFRQVESPAKTASVWQVREDLHAASSGRWQNYEPYIREMQAVLKPE